MGTWDRASELDPDTDGRFHRTVRDGGGWPHAMRDPQDEPAFTGCRMCGAEDCPGSRPLGVCVRLRPAPLEGMEPDGAEERIEDAR